MTENNSASVRVSMRDIYQEVQRQGRVLEKIANSLPDVEDKISDHEQRLRKLETRVGWVFGGLGLLSALLGVFSFSLSP